MKLPALMDRKAVAEETGLPRSAIDAIFRALPVVSFPDSRKVFVKRDDVLALIEASTYDGTQVRP